MRQTHLRVVSTLPITPPMHCLSGRFAGMGTVPATAISYSKSCPTRLASGPRFGASSPNATILDSASLATLRVRDSTPHYIRLPRNARSMPAMLIARAPGANAASSLSSAVAVCTTMHVLG
jgi:hypothetical protein